MIAQVAIRVKVVEDGISATRFTGAVALSKRGRTMGLLADADHHAGWVKECQCRQ